MWPEGSPAICCQCFLESYLSSTSCGAMLPSGLSRAQLNGFTLPLQQRGLVREILGPASASLTVVRENHTSMHLVMPTVPDVATNEMAVKKKTSAAARVG